ncbi:MAG: fasciclin domain-containing protein [Verrucomicrobiota bacterium]
MKSITLTTALLSLVLATNVAAADRKDIVDTAVGAGSFKTLAAALGAAGLVDTLKGDGPFTVFAPTDEAFAKLPEGTVESLLKPENKDQLVDILTYHVVSGEVPFSVAAGLDKAEALNKKSIAVSVTGGTLTLNESKVIENDIPCTNGIIHVIDTVLLPPAPERKTSQTASDLIKTAISKGARLYNHGQHEASAAIYQVTAKALMTMPEGSVSGADRSHLEKAMKMCAGSHCATTNAWTMRHALDRVLASNSH